MAAKAALGRLLVLPTGTTCCCVYPHCALTAAGRAQKQQLAGSLYKGHPGRQRLVHHWPPTSGLAALHTLPNGPTWRHGNRNSLELERLQHRPRLERQQQHELQLNIVRHQQLGRPQHKNGLYFPKKALATNKEWRSNMPKAQGLH